MYRKNTASQFVCVQLLLTATGAVATGLSPTVRRCIDGTFAAGGGTVTEDSNGFYKYAMAQADTNGNDISLTFSATGAVPVCINFVTTAADPTNAATFGITDIDATISSRMATFTPLTAAQIATGVWTDTTAGDFTTALSVGKSLMNGVSLGTGLTVNDITTKTGYSLSGTQTFNLTGSITGSLSGSVGSVTGAVGSVTGAVGSVTGAVGSVTGNVGGNVVGSVASVTARVIANSDQIAGVAGAATNLSKSANAIVRGTCSGGSTTTAIVSTLTTPGSLTASGQLIGRTILFDSDTASAGLQGQASNITASTTGSTPTITFTAMTTAVANGDTFSIV